MVARRVIEQVAPDLVYVNSTSAGEYVIEALRASAGVVLHSREMGERLRGFVSRYRLRADEGLVLAACSSAAAADLADVLAVARADVAVIHDAVDSEGVSTLAGTPPKPQFPTVIAVGTMEERKGTSDFLDIAEVVLASVNARFVWIGGGPLFDVMRREISARGLQDSVRLAGELDNPYPAIKGAEVLVSTSMEETFGLAIAEGMALGTPVAAYKVGGVPEAMGGTGIAVAPGDKQGMVTAVISLIRSPELCARIADEQLAHVREALSPERLKQQVLRLVGRLIR
jgi:glycosyltransferase involved in cell wall biosynthesis